MSKKILVVDDDPGMLFIMRAFLEMEEFQIIEAVDGKKALDLLQSMKIDLVISDVLMPIMDGIELVKEMKTHSGVSHIPIILLSAAVPVLNGLEDWKIVGLQVGANRCFRKPFDYHEIVAAVRELLPPRDG